MIRFSPGLIKKLPILFHMDVCVCVCVYSMAQMRIIAVGRNRVFLFGNSNFRPHIECMLLFFILRPTESEWKNVQANGKSFKKNGTGRKVAVHR